MVQPTPVTQSPGNPALPTVPEYHAFRDDSKPNVDFCLYKIRVDSDEDRAYEKLSTDDERLQYMRLHAHEKVDHVSPKWTFYQDNVESKRYSIRIASPEGEEVERLLGDSDDEFEEGSPEMEAVARYFKEHAHEVETMTDGDICPLR